MIEVDAALAKLALSNALANRWETRVSVVRADVASSADVPAGAADLVVCNPPYVPPGRGRPPALARAVARSGPLEVFLDAARRLAGRRARVCFVYPAGEATTLLAQLRARGLEPKRLCLVHGRRVTAAAGGASPEHVGPARIVLVEAVAGRAGGLTIEPPFFEALAPA
jgi:tRNA1Val (adenine37-N6)-methyltransferase